MTRLRELLAPIVIAAATLAGCAGTGTMTVVVQRRVDAPPAQRVELAEYRAGYVFIQGHWVRGDRGQWTWSPGYYEAERPGYVFIEGRWTDDERGGHIWVDGEWRRRGGLAMGVR